jgi:hypothetical protein
LQAGVARRLRNLHPRYFHDKRVMPDSVGLRCHSYASGQWGSHDANVTGCIQLLIFRSFLFVDSRPCFIVCRLPYGLWQRRLHSWGPAVESMVKQGEFRFSETSNNFSVPGVPP